MGSGFIEENALSVLPAFRLSTSGMGACETNDIERLVLAARAGETDAFEALAARFRPTAFLVARSVLGDREAAQDAVQDAFLTAFRALEGLEEPTRFGPWFAAIVRNRAKRLAREGYRVHTRPLSTLDREILASAPSLAGSIPEPGEEATHALPDGIRESMLLYYFDGWSVGDIAALLDRPVTTVKWQLHAGRALLRKRLSPPENP